jgi:hypothetical protein
MTFSKLAGDSKEDSNVQGAPANVTRYKLVLLDEVFLLQLPHLRERHGYIERRGRTGKREEEAHTRTPTRVKRPGQPH